MLRIFNNFRLALLSRYGEFYGVIEIRAPEKLFRQLEKEAEAACVFPNDCDMENGRFIKLAHFIIRSQNDD